MLSTTMSRIIRALNELRAQGISDSMIAGAAGIPQATFSAAVRGRLYLGGKEEADLYELVVRCTAAVSSLSPLAVERGNGEALRLLADKSPEEIKRAVDSLLGES